MLLLLLLLLLLSCTTSSQPRAIPCPPTPLPILLLPAPVVAAVASRRAAPVLWRTNNEAWPAHTCRWSPTFGCLLGPGSSVAAQDCERNDTYLRVVCVCAA
ncbi:hypothetical protein Hamer_G005647 [Homarus americanus]|uniref:Secreted protein n=1 Tax=Homarus americanus TaxID=6706 RepID=A0A8J5JZI9_HOMAM|nr:hypothetical protein Hamer_G005647 [Homarus americanus]